MKLIFYFPLTFKFHCDTGDKAMGTDATKVIIFDCDGVLFDSRDANIAFYNQILSQFQLSPMTREEIEYVHVNTAEEAFRYLLLRRDPHIVEEVLAHRPRVDYTPFIRLMRMETNLRELLRSLPQEIKRAVSTNRSYTTAMSCASTVWKGSSIWWFPPWTFKIPSPTRNPPSRSSTTLSAPPQRPCL